MSQQTPRAAGRLSGVLSRLLLAFDRLGCLLGAHRWEPALAHRTSRCSSCGAVAWGRE